MSALQSVQRGGVLCFGGEDWWYHNRGHCDMQFMRQFSRYGPVLYVNSVVMRKPNLSEGRMFFRRLLRKARSMTRGMVRVDERFWVYSPVTLPVHHLPLARPLNQQGLRAQVYLAGRRAGLARPIVWVNCPAAADAAIALERSALVYQRTDRYEEFPGVDRQQIRAFDRRLKAAADLTFYSNRELFECERGECRRGAYVDHGVDFALFAEAAGGARPPDELRGVRRPIAGFYGGIDAHTFDLGLAAEVVRRLPEVTFVFVGKASIDCAALASQSNVVLIGQQPYERIPQFGTCFDVCLMPWNQNDWIRACNPIKLKEYLALGKPVVSTPFSELESYTQSAPPLVYAAAGAAAFADAIRQALKEDSPAAAAARRARVREHSWAAKAAYVLELLEPGDRGGAFARETGEGPVPVAQDPQVHREDAAEGGCTTSTAAGDPAPMAAEGG